MKKNKICICLAANLHPHVQKQENHFMPYEALFIWPASFEEAYIYHTDNKISRNKKINICDLKEELNLIANSCEIVYLYAAIEWTNYTFMSPLVEHIKQILKNIEGAKEHFTHIHIGDTHHGRDCLVSAIKTLNTHKHDIDLVTCNQFHHLHFLHNSNYMLFANIAKISPFTRQEYHNYSNNNEKISNIQCWFGAQKSIYHKGRTKYVDYIERDKKLKEMISLERFTQYRDRLKRINESKNCLYIPLSTSIGTNNIIPIYIMGSRLIQKELSEYTGQQKLGKIFKTDGIYVEKPKDLLRILQQNKKDIPSNVKELHMIYENEYTTTFVEFLKMSKKGIMKRETYSPTFWDSRHKKIVEYHKYMSVGERLMIACIYEDIQKELEEIQTDKVTILYNNSDNNKQHTNHTFMIEYMKLIFKDLSPKIKQGTLGKGLTWKECRERIKIESELNNLERYNANNIEIGVILGSTTLMANNTEQ